MKKNIPLLQSLTLSVLVAPSFVLGMDETTKPMTTLIASPCNETNKPIPTPASKKKARENRDGNRVPPTVNNDNAPGSAMIAVKKDSLEESVMITTVPTTRGFGFLRSLKDAAQYIPVIGNNLTPEENLYADLVNKTFDTNNSSYTRKLDTVIENLVRDKKNQRVTEIFTECRKDHYKRCIKIGDASARMAHDFLVQENKNKQAELKKTLENKDILFIQMQNALLKTLQLSIDTQIKEIGVELQKHIIERDDLVKQEGDEIRRLKTGLVHTHKLNRTFVLPDNGYCSDEERDADNVKNSYSDKHLLAKIKVDDSIANTTAKTAGMLARLININKELQSIRQLHYEQRDS